MATYKKYEKYKDSGVEWIGVIPDSWETAKIKNIAQFMPSCDTSRLNDESVITFSPMECIKQGYFENRERRFGDINGSYTPFSEGDIVFAKVTPCFENGNLSIMENLHSGYGLGSSELFVLRAQKINDRYLFYFLQNQRFIDAGCATMTGAGGLKRVSSTFVQNCGIPLPPQDEQAAISAYLDDKVGQIDSVIAEAKASIDEYKNWKASIIYEAVTKGLDPNAEMKDSGVEWIGEMPVTWTVCSLKNVTTKIGSGKTPSGGADVYTNEGIIFLRSQNIYNEGLKLDNVSYISEEIDSEMKNTRVEYLDVLLNITGGSIGRCCVFDLRDTAANVNQHVCILRTNKEKYLPQFLRYFWNSAAGPVVVDQFQTGGNRPGLNFEQIGSTKVPLCNIDTQAKIVAYLEQKTSQINSVISEKEALIADLEAYKKSLIFEVVTGKRKVV